MFFRTFPVIFPKARGYPATVSRCHPLPPGSLVPGEGNGLAGQIPYKTRVVDRKIDGSFDFAPPEGEGELYGRLEPVLFQVPHQKAVAKKCRSGRGYR